MYLRRMFLLFILPFMMQAQGIVNHPTIIDSLDKTVLLSDNTVWGIVYEEGDIPLLKGDIFPVQPGMHGKNYEETLYINDNEVRVAFRGVLNQEGEEVLEAFPFLMDITIKSGEDVERGSRFGYLVHLKGGKLFFYASENTTILGKKDRVSVIPWFQSECTVINPHTQEILGHGALLGCLSPEKVVRKVVEVCDDYYLFEDGHKLYKAPLEGNESFELSLENDMPINFKLENTHHHMLNIAFDTSDTQNEIILDLREGFVVMVHSHDPEDEIDLKMHIQVSPLFKKALIPNQLFVGDEIAFYHLESFPKAIREYIHLDEALIKRFYLTENVYR